ncbi:MAG: sigma-70 factor domain-containing protein, partial [Actinomycetota bacterium]
MSKHTADAAAESTPYAGVDASEWNAMVERGVASGVLHADDIAHVLRHVVLTGDVLVDVHASLGEKGITIDDHVEDVPDATPAEGIALPAQLTEEVDGILARRHRKRQARMALERHDTGGTNDTVRMYLKEIGRVDLLTPADERRLAQDVEAGIAAAVQLDELHGSGEPAVELEHKLMRV